MIQEYRFNGLMNKDDGDEFIGKGQHKYANNLRFYGGQEGLRAENIKGLTQIPYTLPAGDNQCIGSFYDPVRQRIIWFNYNSNGRNGIYQYIIETGVASELLVCFTDSVDDILEFSPNFPIPSVVLIYTTEDDGDILHWTDRLNRPFKLNLKDAEENLYGAEWLQDYLTVNRQTPQLAPSCTYSDDASVSINNLRSKLYQFRYRFWYKDNTKSTWSTYSKLFTPANPDDLATNVDPTKNNRIDVTLTTGGEDCTKIEIAFRQSIVNTFSDCFLIPALDKDELSIDDNTTYTYQFYNDGAYTPLDPKETNLLWSNVPQLANTMELLNGNVIIYGATTEGYDYDEVQNITVEVTLIDNPDASALYILSYLSGRNWVFMFLGNPEAGDIIILYVTLVFANGNPDANYSYGYAVQAGDDAEDVSLAFIALINASPDLVHATQRTDSNGTSGILIIGDNAFDVVQAEQDPEITYINPDPAIDDISIAMFHPLSRYKIGRVYFDEFDETNGVVTNADLDIITPEVNTTSQTQMTIPQIHIEVNDQPPIWAKSFSWVFTNSLTYQTTLYTVSCQTLQDGNFGYLNITNQQNNENKYPQYSYLNGDRVRVIGQFGSAVTLVDVPIVDFVTDPTILGVVTVGIFLKVPFDATVMASWGVGQPRWTIEIYTPTQNTSEDSQIYWEVGERYLVLNPYTADRAHQGMVQDQVVGVQPAIYNFIRGDFYIRTRKLQLNANLTDTQTVWIIDQSVSDQYPSRVKNNGRPYVIDKSAKNDYYMTRSRWSQSYFQNTNINQTNIFYPEDLDEIDRAKGDIQRFKTRERILRVFQNRGCGQYGVYARFIQNNQGQNELVTTNEIITTNNIQYYLGEFGVGDQFTGLVSATMQDYFVDPVRGYQIRLSQDGITPISELYKGQFYIRNLLTPYNKTYLRSDGSIARILGTYNFFDEEYITVLQGGTNNGSTIDSYAFSFNERRNGYCSFFDYNTLEWITCAEDTLYMWKNGELWVQDNETRCNFFGVQYDAEIQVPFNDNLYQKKSWQSIIELGNTTWECPEIYSNVNTYTGQRQETNAGEREFTTYEGMATASVKRDRFSRGGKTNGSFMKGNYLIVTLKKDDASALTYLDSVTAVFVDSPLNRT